MKYNSFLLVVACCIISGCSSLGTPALADGHQPNGIDSLQTDEEMFAFIRTIPGCSSGEFFTYYNETIHVADSLHVRRWAKADIDQNGETDMLLFGAGSLPHICALLSMDGGYEKIGAEYWCKYQFIYPVVTTIDKQPVVLLYNQDQTGYDDVRKHFTYTKISCDTLMVRDKLFLNYVHHPAKHEIEKIEFHNDGVCEGECPRIDIRIDAKTFKNTCFKDEPWDHDVVSYVGTLSPEQIKRILRILENSNFPTMKEKYGVGCSDATTTTLRITYDGGKEKNIEDYGGSGNFTLSELYNVIYEVKWAKK